MLGPSLLNSFLFDIFDYTEIAESAGNADLYLGPCQTSMMELLAEIDKKFIL